MHLAVRHVPPLGARLRVHRAHLILRAPHEDGTQELGGRCVLGGGGVQREDVEVRLPVRVPGRGVHHHALGGERAQQRAALGVEREDDARARAQHERAVAGHGRRRVHELPGRDRQARDHGFRLVAGVRVRGFGGERVQRAVHAGEHHRGPAAARPQRHRVGRIARSPLVPCSPRGTRVRAHQRPAGREAPQRFARRAGNSLHGPVEEGHQQRRIVRRLRVEVPAGARRQRGDACHQERPRGAPATHAAIPLRRAAVIVPHWR